ncbi:MAG: hypothetical protein HYX67_08785 [Candidatus Melainabacteria bacterium]|nr:hypothetical protein [Candidatus Melainabacteria bacterium]
MQLQRIVLQDNTALQKLVLTQLQDLAGKIELLEQDLGSQSGPLCLGVDEERRFVLLISSIVEEDAILLKALGQLNWIVRHHSLRVRLFNKQGVEFSPSPRATLIAPSFSTTLQETIAFIAFDIDLYEYRAVELNHERGLLLDPVLISGRKMTSPTASASPVFQDSSSKVQLTDTERKFFEGFFPKSLPT